MKVLFIVTSYWAIGEMEIAIQFANGLRKDCEILFLIPRKHKEYVNDKGFKSISLYFKIPSINKAMLKNIEESFCPDYIILADYLNYHFCRNHYGLVLDDLDVFKGKIGAFDLYNQVSNPRKMDTYGFQSKLIEVDSKIDFILHPCPLLDSSVDNPQNKHFAISLVDNTTIRTDEEKCDAKRQIGFADDSKVILVTNAQWQSTYRKYPEAIAFVEEADEIFLDLLEELAKKYHVIMIGEKKRDFSNVTYMHYLPPDEFELYVNATDLLISRNIISTSFAKNVLRGIQGITLINSDSINHGYRCKMFPVGWFDYIASLEQNNLYFKLFKQVEMFDINECLNEIERQLFQMQDCSLLKEYHSQLNSLKLPIDILKSLESFDFS